MATMAVRALIRHPVRDIFYMSYLNAMSTSSLLPTLIELCSVAYTKNLRLMKLLVDTDAFCKLGLAELLDDTASVFNVSLQEFGRLAALPYMLRRGAIRKLYGPRACDTLIPIAEAIPVMNHPSVTWLDKLTSIDAIDPGEAQIFAAAAESGMIVISGDKRSLRVGGYQTFCRRISRSNCGGRSYPYRAL